MAKGTLGGSLTIRLNSTLKQKLVRRARERRMAPSELARSILEEALNEQPEGDLPTLFERTKKLVGSVSSGSAPSGRDARKELAAWKPDRRG
jgi:hypothetical protein